MDVTSRRRNNVFADDIVDNSPEKRVSPSSNERRHTVTTHSGAVEPSSTGFSSFTMPTISEINSSTLSGIGKDLIAKSLTLFSDSIVCLVAKFRSYYGRFIILLIGFYIIFLSRNYVFSGPVRPKLHAEFRVLKDTHKFYREVEGTAVVADIGLDVQRHERPTLTALLYGGLVIAFDRLVLKLQLIPLSCWVVTTTLRLVPEIIFKIFQRDSSHIGGGTNHGGDGSSNHSRGIFSSEEECSRFPSPRRESGVFGLPHLAPSGAHKYDSYLFWSQDGDEDSYWLQFWKKRIGAAREEILQNNKDKHTKTLEDEEPEKLLAKTQMKLVVESVTSNDIVVADSSFSPESLKTLLEDIGGFKDKGGEQTASGNTNNDKSGGGSELNRSIPVRNTDYSREIAGNFPTFQSGGYRRMLGSTLRKVKTSFGRVPADDVLWDRMKLNNVRAPRRLSYENSFSNSKSKRRAMGIWWPGFGEKGKSWDVRQNLQASLQGLEKEKQIVEYIKKPVRDCKCDLSCKKDTKIGYNLEGFGDETVQVDNRDYSVEELGRREKPPPRIGYSILTGCKRFDVVTHAIQRLVAMGVSKSDVFVFLTRCKPSLLEKLPEEQCQLLREIRLVAFFDPSSYTKCGSEGLKPLEDNGIASFPFLNSVYHTPGETEENSSQDSKDGIFEAKDGFFARHKDVLGSPDWKSADFRARIYLIWVIGMMFTRYNYAVMLQDNLDLSPKLADFFQYGTQLMDIDNSVLGFTAWNNLQQEVPDVNLPLNVPVQNQRNVMVLRQQGFMGIAWMTSREMFKNIIYPFVSLTEWITDGEWAAIMKILVRPRRQLYPMKPFKFWALKDPKTGKRVDKNILSKYFQKDEKYSINHDDDSSSDGSDSTSSDGLGHDKLGVRRVPLNFFYPTVGLVHHKVHIAEGPQPAQTQTESAQMQTTLERIEKLSFWSLSEDITWPRVSDLTAWRYDIHYMERQIMGQWVERENVTSYRRLPDFDTSKVAELPQSKVINKDTLIDFMTKRRHFELEMEDKKKLNPLKELENSFFVGGSLLKRSWVGSGGRPPDDLKIPKQKHMKRKTRNMVHFKLEDLLGETGLSQKFVDDIDKKNNEKLGLRGGTNTVDSSGTNTADSSGATTMSSNSVATSMILAGAFNSEENTIFGQPPQRNACANLGSIWEKFYTNVLRQNPFFSLYVLVILFWEAFLGCVIGAAFTSASTQIGESSKTGEGQHKLISGLRDGEISSGFSTFEKSKLISNALVQITNDYNTLSEEIAKPVTDDQSGMSNLHGWLPSFLLGSSSPSSTEEPRRGPPALFFPKDAIGWLVVDVLGILDGDYWEMGVFNWMDFKNELVYNYSPFSVIPHRGVSDVSEVVIERKSTEIRCARIHCYDSIKKEHEQKQWFHIDKAFPMVEGLATNFNSYKGTLVLFSDEGRNVIVTQYSPWFQALCK